MSNDQFMLQQLFGSWSLKKKVTHKHIVVGSLSYPEHRINPYTRKKELLQNWVLY